MAKFCENCGFALEPGSSFCPNCGSPVPVEPKNEEQPEVREEEQAEQIEERVEGQIEEQTEEQAAELTAGPAGDDAPLPPAREETPEAQPAHFSGFCGMCGSPLDPATGECPVCSARREMNVPAQEQPPVYTAPPAPPYQPAPDYRTAPKAPKKAGKPKKKKSKGRGAVVILLFILFVVLSLVCLSLFIARNTASEKSMERILKPVSYNDFTESVGSDVSGQVEDMYKGVDEKLEPYGISTTITDESFAEFIDGSNVRSLIAEKASGLVDGILSDGDVTVRLTRSEAGDFLEENKALIKEKLGGKPLTMAIPARTRTLERDAYNYAKLSEIADRIIIMAYDEHWSTSKPGAIASTDWCKRIAEYTRTQIPEEKLIMGLSFYGRTWMTAPVRAQAWYNSGIERIKREQGVAEISRDSYGTPHFTFKEEVTITAWYDDIDSLKIRAKMYSDLGIKKIAFWRVGQENSEFWKYLGIGR